MRNVTFISAGAGSGKTYRLTAKLAELIKAGETTPSRVILTTFTKMAAAEFRVKARKMLLDMGMHDRAAEMESATIGTVHSVALSYIKRYWYLLGLGAGVDAMPEEDEARYISATLFRVATPEDVSVFRKYAEAVPVRDSNPPYGMLYDFWQSDIKKLVESSETFGIEDLSGSLSESMTLFDDIFQDEPDGEMKKLRRDVIRRLFRMADDWRKEFTRYKQEHNLISYNDMERLFLKLLDMPQVREDISSGTDFVFVDEFQDSNPTQVRIFDKLSEIVSKGSFWVGDPKQAIYDFRGCDTRLTGAVTSLIEAKHNAREKGFGYTVLDESYRSDPALVDLANKVFVPVFEGVLSEDKVALTAHNKSLLPPEQPRIIHWNMIPGQTSKGRASYSEEVVVATLSANIFNLLHGGGPVSEVVDKDSGEVRPLRPSDIAVLCRKDREVNNLVAKLMEAGVPVSCDQKRESVSIELAFILAALNYLLGNSTLLEAEIAFMYEGTEVKDIIERPEGLHEREVFARLDRLKEALRGKPVSYVVSSVIDALDLERRSSVWGDGASRMNTLEAVKAKAASYEQQCIGRGEAATLGGFINDLSENGVTVDGGVVPDGVTVMTYHKAKGLEWNVVILSSLSENALDAKKFQKWNYFGVNVIRLTEPTPDNLYSDFVLRYIPQSWPTATANLQPEVVRRIDARSDARPIREKIRSELARLMYVGVTRARDVLITFSPKVEDMAWLKNIGIESPGCDGINGGWGPIWGNGKPKAWILKVGQDAMAVTPEEESVETLAQPQGWTERRPKYLQPSSLTECDGEGSYSCVFPTAGAPERIPVTSCRENQYDLIGTGIHNIFAAMKEGEPEHNAQVARETVRRYGFKEILTDPGAIVKAWDKLYAFMCENYGKPAGVHHELPFALLKEGRAQVITGDMDLVWETEGGVVLVDFKNYPGYDNVLDPSSEFHVQKYLPQMASYREALEKAGKTVLATLVYYAVQGRIIKVDIK